MIRRHKIWQRAALRVIRPHDALPHNDYTHVDVIRSRGGGKKVHLFFANQHNNRIGMKQGITHRFGTGDKVNDGGAKPGVKHAKQAQDTFASIGQHQRNTIALR